MTNTSRPDRSRYISLSCISVGVASGGRTPMLARVGIVDFSGNILLDKFVIPEAPVVEYRTSTTGITAADLDAGRGAVSFKELQRQVLSLFQGRIIVGHQVWKDLAVLGLSHRAVDTRDTALYYPFRNTLNSPGEIIGLRTLMWRLMGRRCQEHQLHPIETARATMDLYRTYRQEWELDISKGEWPCDMPPANHAGYFV